MHEKRGVVKIVSSSKKFLRHAKRVEKAAEACLLFSPTKTKDYLAKRAEVHIFLIKDEEMRTINKKFRNKNKVTSVLSFKEPRGFPRPDLGGVRCLGEVYLAPEYIEKKGEHIEALVIHGILHSVGYTHNKVRDRMEMEKTERNILNRLQNANS